MESISGISIKYILQDNNNWQRFYDKHHDLIREDIVWNIEKLFSCRTALGYHKYICLDCGHTVTVPHTCKSRICSPCGTVATDNWISQSLNEFLDVKYQHIVFSMPSSINTLVLFNRKLLLDTLFKCVRNSVLSWTKKNKSYIPGLLIVLHTFGRDLKFNCHFHILITCGGLSLDKSKWISNFYIPHDAIKKMWRYNVISSLRRLFKEQSLTLPDKEQFSNYASFNKYLNNLYSKTWYVNLGASLKDASFTVGYIGRYTKRPVIAETRITSYDGHFVRFFFKDLAVNKTFHPELSVEDFIARFIRHIPDRHFRQVRYAGIFASRVKTSSTAIARKLLNQIKKVTIKILSWRQRRIKSKGTDPLTCPKCLKEMFLSVIAYPNKYGELKAIFCHSP